MNPTTLHILGIVSVIIVAVAVIPYWIDIIRGNTKPQRTAFFILTVLSVIAFFGQVQEGADASLWFAGFLLFNQVVLFCLAIRYGMSGFSRLDKISLVLSAIILLAWYATDSAALTLVLTTLVNTIGKYLITVKVWRDPYSDMPLAWLLAAIASGFAALSVGQPSWILLLVPVHNGITVAVIAAVIYLRRYQLSKPS